jgi:hypothetical protein
MSALDATFTATAYRSPATAQRRVGARGHIGPEQWQSIGVRPEPPIRIPGEEMARCRPGW